MVQTQIPCQYTDCQFVAEHASEAVALAIFGSHVVTHQQPATTRAPAKQKLPPIERPHIKQDVTDEDWASFIIEWRRFKRCTDIPAGQEADQLFDCCERGLGRLLIKENPDIIAAGEDELLVALKRMAVIKIATSVRRAKLLASKQDHGESIREFYANVKAQASTCDFNVKCVHTCCVNRPKTDYTALVIKDILVSGIADNEIRKDVLGWPELDAKSDKEVFAFVEDKETAKKAWSGEAAGAAGISAYKKPANSVESEAKKKLAMKGKCSKCNTHISLYTRYRSGRLNSVPFHMCYKCFKVSNKGDNIEDVPSIGRKISPDGGSESGAITSFIGAIDSKATLQQTPSSQTKPTDSDGSTKDKIKCVALDHHIFTTDGWQKATTLTHPTLRLRITTCSEDYKELGVPRARIAPKYIDVVADSGAQSSLWSRKEFLKSGFSMKDLIGVHHAMEAANTAPINIDGAIILRLTGCSESGDEVEAAVMTYISPDAKRFYLSREAMMQLGVISRSFPQIGASHTTDISCNAITTEEKPYMSKTTLTTDCSCLKREPPPGRPTQFPFECIPSNCGKMKAWLLDRYASSSLNKCPHQVLPAMEGPPIEFHIYPQRQTSDNPHSSSGALTLARAS